MKRFFGLVSLGLGLTTHLAAAEPVSSAREGKPEGVRHFGGQREFAVGPTAGQYSGIGAMLGFGSVVGAWLSGGYTPLLITGTDSGGSRSKYDFYSSAQGNADLALTPWHPTLRSSIGMIAGYKYNTVIGHGGSAGITFSYDFNRTLALRALAGFGIFPDAEQGLRDHGYPAQRDPVLPWFQGGVNLGLAIYP